jgi:hypothetical protein
MARGSSRTVVKRSRDEALEHIKIALRTKSCLLTKQEMSFIRTSWQILGVDGPAMIKTIQKEVEDEGMRQFRKVMEHLQTRLKELADRVEKHKRPTPNPAGCTRTTNSMGASVRSLASLVGCVEALKEAMGEQYSKGIKAGMKALENAKLDYKNTIDRLTEACRWKAETTEDWTRRGEAACGDLLERAQTALKEAEEREEAEAKIRIMETQCEALADLAVQAGKQVPAEAEAEVLEELEEEMDHREGVVEALGQALKDVVPESLKDRVEEGDEGNGRSGSEEQAVCGPRESPVGLQQGHGVQQLQDRRRRGPGGLADRGGGARGGVGGVGGGDRGGRRGAGGGGNGTHDGPGIGRGGHEGRQNGSQVSGGAHEGPRANAGQRQRVAHVRWAVR